MKRAVTAALLFTSTLMFRAAGQEPRSSSAIESGIQETQLIAWSVMQTPEPLGRCDAAQPQSLRGTVIREQGRYVLRIPDNRNYELDDQTKAANFEGRQVRIAGKLDEDSKKIYVESIGLLS